MRPYFHVLAHPDVGPSHLALLAMLHCFNSLCISQGETLMRPEKKPAVSTRLIVGFEVSLLVFSGEKHGSRRGGQARALSRTHLQHTWERCIVLWPRWPRRYCINRRSYAPHRSTCVARGRGKIVRVTDNVRRDSSETRPPSHVDDFSRLFPAQHHDLWLHKIGEDVPHLPWYALLCRRCAPGPARVHSARL